MAEFVISEEFDEYRDVISEKVKISAFQESVYLEQTDYYLSPREFAANEEYLAVVALTRTQAKELYKFLGEYLSE